ncbi:hypothetical protein [Hymenobacter defluvii]|uniref:Uncharacterized protein n=1 Tax=Hymenobacter defluvii TaxID=2054411 RepID=A0ABS3TH19_9BACT|nr:hypothetical protein [Hymenobacter defluvii]MBO3272010.1 hypothetical protein [Hymenobacter defluvii]
MTRKEVRAHGHRLHKQITSMYMSAEDLPEDNVKRITAIDELDKIKNELHELEIDLEAPSDALVDSEAGVPLLNKTSKNFHAIERGLNALHQELRDVVDRASE